MNAFTHIHQVWEALERIPRFKDSGANAVHYALTGIEQLCDLVGNPQNELNGIHIAGTNGKGTTAHLLEHIYCEAGYSVGLFTSPHLMRYNERVRVGKEEIPDEDIINYFNLINPLLEEQSVTFFEISTGLAFWYFRQKNVDIAVIETGLGGRLDSTNIITPLCSIITSIGYDHQDVLGHTLENIAYEKAGIIKNSIPVVIGNIPDQVKPVIRRKAKDVGSRVWDCSELNPAFHHGRVHLTDGRQWNTTFIEPVNAWNVTCAVQCVALLNRAFPVEEQQLNTAIETCPPFHARFEKLTVDRDWYFTGAHNEQALAATLEAVQRVEEGRTPILIFTLMNDKLTPEVAACLRQFPVRWFLESDSPRALTNDELGNWVEADTFTERMVLEKLDDLTPELVIFAGSFYFYSTVRRWIGEIQP
ncbi:MAG: folylpolyglutamate synthase/dihydrofolate synthase family protein [Bacteroidota bacterium]